MKINEKYFNQNTWMLVFDEIRMAHVITTPDKHEIYSRSPSDKNVIAYGFIPRDKWTEFHKDPRTQSKSHANMRLMVNGPVMLDKLEQCVKVLKDLDGKNRIDISMFIEGCEEVINKAIGDYDRSADGI